MKFNYHKLHGKHKIHIIFIICLIASLLLYLTHVTTKTWQNNKPGGRWQSNAFQEASPKATPFKGSKIVHLDLKGAPPKTSYYNTLFPLFSTLGATGILLEYEDMFPYQSPLLKNVSAHNAYTPNEIKYINELAAKNNLDVIPLVQTFGHMEFLLKLEEFKEFREVAEYPQTICPTHKNTLTLVMEMVDQVIKMHPKSTIIHIGSDEVYHIGYCERCNNFMTKFNLSKKMLYLKHINSLTSSIHKKYPQLKILMWDEEFRHFSLQELKHANLSKAVVPVVWKYARDVYEDLGPSLWDMYAKVFPRVWAASAFKGATGSDQHVPDVTHYVQNHRSWLSLMTEYKNVFTFEGIVLTGWQRYDHFAILCELLPVALPSLAMSLRVLMGYNDSPISPPTEVAKILGCEQPYALIGPAFGSPKCSYVGGDILENVLKLHQLRQEYDTLLDDSRVKGWFSDYNKKHAFGNPVHVRSVLGPLNRIRIELLQVEHEITGAMYDIYDNYTITEWKEMYIMPFKKLINDMIDARDRVLARNTWPRRPLYSCDNCNEL